MGPVWQQEPCLQQSPWRGVSCPTALPRGPDLGQLPRVLPQPSLLCPRSRPGVLQGWRSAAFLVSPPSPRTNSARLRPAGPPQAGPPTSAAQTPGGRPTDRLWPGAQGRGQVPFLTEMAATPTGPRLSARDVKGGRGVGRAPLGASLVGGGGGGLDLPGGAGPRAGLRPLAPGPSGAGGPQGCSPARSSGCPARRRPPAHARPASAPACACERRPPPARRPGAPCSPAAGA